MMTLHLPEVFCTGKCNCIGLTITTDAIYTKLHMKILRSFLQTCLFHFCYSAYFENETVEIIQHDNPNVIFPHNGDILDYSELELNIYGKRVLNQLSNCRKICMIAMSDGFLHAGIGRALNPDLPITFNIRMNLVKELSECLKQMGKRIKVSYF